ncbi:outer membrane lipoprotein [Shewanella youngdeokensis]|uniref:Glycine zipper 2TM domain-containing protein n=1 Tax=Shewanella youngdeokensis TaxID=2999068 RepID=A0ABZ0K1X4_9GAMM|nr:glycine zipper 2TM domain-containing protein [Shewanella sp. DAU334]
MLKPHLIVFMIAGLLFSVSTAFAGPYQRNQAVSVEKVEFGHVATVRNITQKQLVEDRNAGWKTFGGALVGGVVGHQFGSGSGQDVATVLGALLGAGIGNNYGDSSYYQELRLIEMMITLDTGEQAMVVQDLDQGMVFNVNDEVRVVYLKGYVRVDKQM